MMFATFENWVFCVVTIESPTKPNYVIRINKWNQSNEAVYC